MYSNTMLWAKVSHSIVLLYICLQKVSRLGQILPSTQVFPVDTHSPTSTSWTYSCLVSVSFVLRMKRIFPALFLAALGLAQYRFISHTGSLGTGDTCLGNL